MVDSGSARVIASLVACNSVSYVPVIDVHTGQVVTRVPVRSDGGRAVAFTPDGQFALLTLERESVLAVIRMSDFALTRYIPLGPAPRGIAIDDNDLTVYASAFSRAMITYPGSPAFKPHTVTVVHLDGVDLSSDNDMPNFEQIPVGFGPCSVVVFDTERAGYQPTKVDTAVRDLVSQPSAL